ncbi:MAG TPA: Spy/CpxP family protein refolding chaperone [Variovorax sp.]
MIPSRKSILAAGLLACATLASSGAFAQTPPPAPDAQAGAQAAAPRAHGPHGADMAQRFERMQAEHAKRLAAMKAKLNLTPAQQGAWDTFAAAQQPPAHPPGDMRARWEEFQKMTTPERLDRMQQRQTERAANFAKRADATRTFYATLSPEQQKTFDTESLPRRAPGGPGGRRHGPPPAKS